MVEFTEVASGLGFPEGPVALPNGDILLVEIQTGRLTKVWALLYLQQRRDAVF